MKSVGIGWGGIGNFEILWDRIGAVSGELPQPPWELGTPSGHEMLHHLLSQGFCPLGRCRGSFRNPRGNWVPLQGTKCKTFGISIRFCPLGRCRGSFRNPRGNWVPLQGTKCETFAFSIRGFVHWGGVGGFVDWGGIGGFVHWGGVGGASATPVGTGYPFRARNASSFAISIRGFVHWGGVGGASATPVGIGYPFRARNAKHLILSENIFPEDPF
jgi:hypothetical protein